MHNPSTQGIIIFIAGITLFLLLLISFIVTIVYKYQQKQNAYFKEMEALNVSHQNALLQSRIEIQEQTFQNISREIHDNIGQKLTLAKLHLNTLNFTNSDNAIMQVNDSVNMIREAINDLSDMSRSMSSEIILNNGLIKALELEAAQLTKSGIFKTDFSVTGDSIFMDANTELVLFRIAQEALNNIIKHAQAQAIGIQLHYNTFLLTMTINDNGKGFNLDETRLGIGLQNMQKRTTMLKGNLSITSNASIGTQLKIEIPIYESTPGI